MFKYIVLLDRGGTFVKEIVNRYPDAKIFLVVEKQPKVIEALEYFKKQIPIFIDYNDFLSVQHVQNIDYSIIEKLKHIQNDVETMLHRVMLNNPLAKDIYHQHLSFFIQIFQDHKIDLILCTEYNLATPSHLIPFGLGKLLGIPTYAIENLPAYPAVSLNNYNKTERVSFKNPCSELTPNSLIFYKHRSLQKPKKKFREKIEYICGAIFIEFVKCLIKRSFTQKYLGIRYSFFDKMNAFFSLKKIKQNYETLACKPDYQKKYIYYSIHLEPEATVIGKTTLESQLTMIKMLSEALPQDWKLYVKEHPHQFMLNTSVTHYFLHNITFFKNTCFYQEINKLHNVSLISLDTPTKELIRNAQAIATINGTVTLEAMFEKKYAILFSGKAGLFGVLGNVLHVSSYQDVQNAIKFIISTHTTISSEKEFEKLKHYLINSKEDNFIANLLETIEHHSKTIQKTEEKLQQ